MFLRVKHPARRGPVATDPPRLALLLFAFRPFGTVQNGRWRPDFPPIPRRSSAVRRRGSPSTRSSPMTSGQNRAGGFRLRACNLRNVFRRVAVAVVRPSALRAFPGANVQGQRGVDLAAGVAAARGVGGVYRFHLAAFVFQRPLQRAPTRAQNRAVQPRLLADIFSGIFRVALRRPGQVFRFQILQPHNLRRPGQGAGGLVRPIRPDAALGRRRFGRPSGGDGVADSVLAFAIADSPFGKFSPASRRRAFSSRCFFFRMPS